MCYISNYTRSELCYKINGFICFYSNIVNKKTNREWKVGYLGLSRDICLQTRRTKMSCVWSWFRSPLSNLFSQGNNVKKYLLNMSSKYLFTVCPQPLLKSWFMFYIISNLVCYRNISNRQHFKSGIPSILSCRTCRPG